MNQPLQSLDEWEDDLRQRYPHPDKPRQAFRDYAAASTINAFFSHGVLRGIRHFAHSRPVISVL